MIAQNVRRNSTQVLIWIVTYCTLTTPKETLNVKFANIPSNHEMMSLDIKLFIVISKNSSASNAENYLKDLGTWNSIWQQLTPTKENSNAHFVTKHLRQNLNVQDMKRRSINWNVQALVWIKKFIWIHSNYALFSPLLPNQRPHGKNEIEKGYKCFYNCSLIWTKKNN